MKERFITGGLLVLLVAVVLLTKLIMNVGIVVDIFIGIIALIACLEFSNILKNSQRFNHKYIMMAFPILFFAYMLLTVKLQLDIVYFIAGIVVLMMLLALISFAFTFVTKVRTEREMRLRQVYTSRARFAFDKALNTSFGFIYPSLLVGVLFIFNHIADFRYVLNVSESTLGTISIIALITAFLLPAFCDTFAYLTGTLIGGKKLAPHISEKKTISGAIGGIVWTSLLLVVLYLLFNSGTSVMLVFEELNITWWSVAMLGVIGGILCTIGDLVESLFKRKANMKDSSDLLPGHGGVLDRVDSLMFSNVAILIFFVIIILV